MNAGTEGLVILDYPCVPEDVCGGVWVAALGRFVSVQPGDPVSPGNTDTTLYEYSTDGGEVRACLLSVPAGSTSPTWKILYGGTTSYYEERRTVAGAGWLDCWSAPVVDWSYRVHTRNLPEPSGDVVTVFPNDTFRVRAAKTTGVHVLAIFSGAAFKDVYEQVVKTPPVTDRGLDDELDW